MIRLPCVLRSTLVEVPWVFMKSAPESAIPIQCIRRIVWGAEENVNLSENSILLQREEIDTLAVEVAKRHFNATV